MTIDNVVFYNKDTKEEVFRIDNVEECVFEDRWGNRHTERRLYKYVIELKNVCPDKYDLLKEVLK